MQMRAFLTCCILIAGTAFGRDAAAQDGPPRRLADVVSVAVAEYRLGVDAAGKVISAIELAEAQSFLDVARDVAKDIAGDSATRIRSVLDSLSAAILSTRPVGVIDDLYGKLTLALGPDGAIEARHGDFDLVAGQRLYTQHCASCHGPSGLGDGPAGASLNPPPAPLAGDSAREMAPRIMYQVISVGVAGTGMPSWSDRLSSDERWDVVEYINAMRTRASGMSGTAGRSAKAVQSDINRHLDSALVAAREGRPDAALMAFDAYVAFEPLEATLKVRRPALVTQMENDFLAFRTAIRDRDMDAAQISLGHIRSNLPAAVLVAEGGTSPWTSFLQSLLIIFREGFEAILIIAAVIAMLQRTGNGGRIRDVWAGAALGLIASAVMAVVLQTVLRAIPASREVIEGFTVLVAVAVLFSVSYWLLSKVEAKHWQAFVHERVHSAVAGGGRAALVGVGFLVVFREGAETALLYQALLQGSASVPHVFGGIIVGAVALTAVYIVLHVFGVRLPLRSFFAVTGTMLYAMAFVFMGHGLRDLQEGGVLPNTPLVGLPTIDAIGIFPSVQTLLGQLILLLLFAIACWRTFMPARSR
jgi:high-affinity iron transporter